MSTQASIMPAGAAAQLANRDAHTDEHQHVSSMRLLIAVLVALLALTALTVFTARDVHLGSTGNLVAALGIAVIKAGLVAAFFMHLLHDKRLNAIVLLFCLMAVGFFLLFTMIDLGSRAAVDPVRNVWTKEPAMVSKAHADGEAAEGGATLEPAPAEEH